jgi:hypothetical protein
MTTLHTTYELPDPDALADARLCARLQREALQREEDAMVAAAPTREDVIRREAREVAQ